MIDKGIPVPEFIVLTDEVFKLFIEQNNLTETIKTIKDAKSDSVRIEKLIMEGTVSSELMDHIQKVLSESNMNGRLAVRSSGLDEDSKDHSFAGMFSSFLFVKGHEELNTSIKKCFASAFSERCLEYRIKNKLPMNSIGMGIVIQKMVNSDISGVMFTRNPMNSSDNKSLVVESLYGQCEGFCFRRL